MALSGQQFRPIGYGLGVSEAKLLVEFGLLGF